MKTLLPFDKKQVPIEIDDQNFVGSLASRVESYHPGKSPRELVEASLDNPIGSPKLEELARGKKNIVIISSDHTRPVPSHIITPILLRRIRAAQPDANINDQQTHNFMKQEKIFGSLADISPELGETDSAKPARVCPTPSPADVQPPRHVPVRKREHSYSERNRHWGINE